MLLISSTYLVLISGLTRVSGYPLTCRYIGIIDLAWIVALKS
jgi:hypothetical protein